MKIKGPQRPWWKRLLIGFTAVILVVLIATCTLFLWVLNKPNRPAPVVTPGPSGRRIAGSGFTANYFPAITPIGRRPAILVLGGSEGGLSDEAREEAILLQRSGFNALQLAYFNGPGMGSKLERVPLEQFYKALDWLKSQKTSDPMRIGILGYSKGAEAALLIATRYPGIKAIVLGMPSNVAWDALSMRGFIFHGVSSWTQNGKDVPSLAYGKPDRREDYLSYFTNAERGLPQNAPPRLPVENFKGSMLLICGGQDSLWPSCPMAQAIIDRQAGRGVARAQLLIYPAAGHGVVGPPMPEQDKRWRSWRTFGGTIQANAKARKDDWPKIVAFFKENLGGAS